MPRRKGPLRTVPIAASAATSSKKQFITSAARSSASIRLRLTRYQLPGRHTRNPETQSTFSRSFLRDSRCLRYVSAFKLHRTLHYQPPNSSLNPAHLYLAPVCQKGLIFLIRFRDTPFRSPYTASLPRGIVETTLKPKGQCSSLPLKIATRADMTG